MAFELRDYFETSDGSRPETRGLDAARAQRFALSAFGILNGGDVFESRVAKADQAARDAAERYIATVAITGGSAEDLAQVRAECVALIGGNASIAARLGLAKPLRIDVAPPGASFVKLGLPRAMSPNVAGIFWDAPEWPSARIVVRQERLPDTPALVAHELGHAVFYLALTDDERQRIYDVLRPTFGSRASMDEAFAIYSEREVQDDFTERDRKASGIYGAVRRQWSNDQVFTRFIRKLYYPMKPLAGPKLVPF